jgi:oligopeptide/dipeptide ABC transporter ATP-binding protein
MKVLEVIGLTTRFYTPEGVVKAVEKVSFEMWEGKTLGLVGESGCGKTVTALSIMRLMPQGKIVSGNVRYKGRELLQLPEDEIRKIRGGEIAMIFQEPLLSLNPVFTIGNQIVEAIVIHKKTSRTEAESLMIRLLELVGIPLPREMARFYPHQLSGGMRQRVMIAMAISTQPSVLIADEPTTALDVTIASQILGLLRELQSKFEMSILLITHDLGVIAEMADAVAVMYAGEIVEYAEVGHLFKKPLHPYTKGLLECLPDPVSRETYLKTIPGYVPDLRNLPPGCNFRDRCPHTMQVCRQIEPCLVEIGSGAFVSCHLYQE